LEDSLLKEARLEVFRREFRRDMQLDQS
jgi:hypothetical protein